MEDNMIQAENGDVPDKKVARKLKKQSARAVTLSLAEGWLAEAERIGKLRKAAEELRAKEDRNKSIQAAMDKVIATAKRNEEQAWMNVMLFALTLTPKHRTKFKRLAYTQFLAKAKLAPHLTPGLPAEELDSEDGLRKAIRKAFNVKMKKKSRPGAVSPRMKGKGVELTNLVGEKTIEELMYGEAFPYSRFGLFHHLGGDH